jgi:hypothetical protein
MLYNVSLELNSSSVTEILYPLANISSVSSLLYSPLTTNISCSTSCGQLLQIPHVSDVTQHLSFCAWLISLNIMFSMFICVIAVSENVIVKAIMENRIWWFLKN